MVWWVVSGSFPVKTNGWLDFASGESGSAVSKRTFAQLCDHLSSKSRNCLFVSQLSPKNRTHEPTVWGDFLIRYGVDRAVAFAVLGRGWQVLTGPLTQLLIIFCLSAVQQGYYSTFLNLLAMQIFVELGLHVVIINVASHEWAGLSYVDGQLCGEAKSLRRLSALWQGALRWYAIAAVIFFMAVAGFGVSFFQSFETSKAEVLSTATWMLPWLVLVGLTAAQLLLLPATSVLEACGQLPVLNRFRFWQAVAGSFGVWAALSFGWGLWALCCSAAVRLLGEAWLVKVHYAAFFDSLNRPANPADQADAKSIWRQEVRPLQWRMAVQGGLMWFASHLAGLVLFDVHGAATAGRFGMMLTVMTAMQSASLAWIETRRPSFGALIAEGRFEELDVLFFRMSKIAIGLLAAGIIMFSVGVEVASRLPYWFFERISERLPTTSSVAVYGTGLIVMQLAQCTNLYVRAHKRDPFMLAATISNLAIAALIFVLGRSYGIPGVALGYAVGVSFVQTPLWVGIWYRTRNAWHQEVNANV